MRANYDFSNIDKQPPSAITFVFRLVLLVVVFILGAFSYRLAEEKGLLKPAPLSQVAGSSDTNTQIDTATKIAKLILIPVEEKPSIAVITDAAKLKATNATFYANAKDGDKLVVYSDRAIIYREEDNIIINIVPITRPIPTANNSSITPKN